MLSVRTALLAFRRAPLLSALSITTIAFSLFAFGLFGLVALNIRDALQHIEERVEIRAFVTDSTSVERLTQASDEVSRFPEVSKVEVVTQTEALARARKELGEFSDVFESEFLPASLDIQLKPGFRDPTTVKKVADRLRGYQFVDDVRYGEEWITQLYRLRNIAGVAGLTLGFAFAAVAIIIIGATIRMAVLARAKEISIMRLVGATDGFIRLPFLIEGALKGILGGALALLGVLFGALIGLMGSAVSVGRHLRRI
jgi:cell division transport system permease protein